MHLTRKCCKLINSYTETCGRCQRIGNSWEWNYKWLNDVHKRELSNNVNNDGKPPWHVLYFGSDDFSIPSLKMLFRQMKAGQLIKQLSVVTSLKGKKNPVRDLALENKLPTYDWPIHTFPDDYDIGLVASFGHLIPEHVIGAFPLGMLNVHASLLPRWRGAAPIIYAILNDDTETGITIMEIKPHKFDVGNIVHQVSCPILPEETALDLKTRLASIGADALLQALRDLPGCVYKSVPQPNTGMTYAPRVTSTLARVNWQTMDLLKVYNLHRALAGIYSLTTAWHGLTIKLLQPTLAEGTEIKEQNNVPGSVVLDQSGSTLCVLCADNRWIGFKAVGVPGKRPMSPRDFYNGYISKRTVMERFFS